MKVNLNRILGKCAMIFVLFITALGCQQYSEQETDRSAGINGGFEISKNNLPVNWLMYTPNTVPDADFKIVLDQTTYKEGKQSLRFDVKACSSVGGWASPGFTNEFYESGTFEGESRYMLSFWTKNNGAKFVVSAGGVAPFEGDMRTLIESDEHTDQWSYFEFIIDVPEERHLRMQLNILEPGTFWIDDVQITKL